MGDNVVIFGAGGIGLNIIQACYLLSASRIIAIDLFDNRLELAQALGATHTINSSSMHPILLRSQIEKILDCQSIDVFIDNTGNTKIIELGYKLLRGRKGCTGWSTNANKVKIHSLDIHFGKKLIDLTTVMLSQKRISLDIINCHN